MKVSTMGRIRKLKYINLGRTIIVDDMIALAYVTQLPGQFTIHELSWKYMYLRNQWH